MSGSNATFLLDLGALPEAAKLLDHDETSLMAKAASFVLERQHGVAERDPALVTHGDESREAQIVRAPITDATRRTFGDLQVATELGAVGIGILTARHVLDRVVFARLPKGTGADYRMHDPNDAAGGDSYERLECSGIGDGSSSTGPRVTKKIRQLARAKAEPPGWAIVTNFVPSPVDVQIRRYAR